MTELTKQVIHALSGKTLATAESCTGGGIGSILTSVSGSSAVFKGGIISYTNEIKMVLLDVPGVILEKYGAVSALVAEAMAKGARMKLHTDIAVSVTGLAGPGGDEFGNPVGTVYIGYCDSFRNVSRKFLFEGDRETVRKQATEAALRIILEFNK